MLKQELKEKQNEFIENERYDEKTIRTCVDYRNATNKFIEFLPDNFEINKKITMDFKDWLTDKKYAVKSKNKYITIVNKFLKFIGYDECTLKKFKEQQKTSIDDPIWEQEHKRMLRWARKLDMEYMYFIIKIFAHTGIRVEELKFFTVENLEKDYIKGIFNKGKARDLILTQELRRELKKYCKENKIETGYIFRSPNPKLKNDSNRMVDVSTVWRNLKKIAKSAKINPDKIHAHAWRHLFAKAFMSIPGNTLEELADILGHSKLETTRIYTMSSKSEKRKKMEKIKY